MSNFRALITGWTPGSSKQVELITLDAPTGILCIAAKLIVKSRPEDDDEFPVLSKEVTTVDVPEVGQITDDGSAGTYTVRIDLTSGDTTAIGMSRMSFYLILELDEFPDPYIPFAGTIVANAKSVAIG